MRDSEFPIPPSYRNYLALADLGHIKLPSYGPTWSTKLNQYVGKDFFWMSRKLGYKGFRGDLNNANPGIILDRKTTEAAFYQVLMEFFEAWPERELTRRVGAGNERREKLNMLWELLVQVCTSALSILILLSLYSLTNLFQIDLNQQRKCILGGAESSGRCSASVN